MKVLKTILASVMISTVLLGNIAFAVTTSYKMDLVSMENTDGNNFVFSGQPGEGFSNGVIITNTSDESTILVDVIIGQKSLVEGSKEMPSEWVTFDSEVTTLTLAPGQSQEVNFTLTVPENAEPGYYLASVKAVLEGYYATDGFVYYKLALGKAIKVTVNEKPEPVVIPTELYAQLRCLKYYNGYQAPVKCNYDLVKSYNIDPIARPFRTCLNNNPNMIGLEACLPDSYFENL